MSLRDCLKRDEAAQAREKIQELLIAYPLFSRPGGEQEPLWEILRILPNLESVRYVTEYHGELTILTYTLLFRCDRYSDACRLLSLQIPKANNSWKIHVDDGIWKK